MSDLKHLFVPYELNIALINKGCNLPCLATFDWNEKIKIFGGAKKTTECVKAYTYQQVVDWFREKHECFILINPAFGYVIRYKEKQLPHLNNSHADRHNTYYEALNKAIEEALNLI